ncbi:hypothetical protein PSEUBRA_004776 [Kalmanozyma brasiliensis GHG001]|uniref:uncharacterized protein n=1 Tax=Kalmanozyma brasiliensis (strain GHG001) TaxID=1365824 RepID=UPI002867DE35|nr:uncharacterized protein PSEUBRA_004776 [Kalmanozyma brasiliensis GHG001]EST05756.2 hypothetical protein PSEUBRA_004776 [Kalmanozyma brasiliensis GHG001]
MAALAVPSTASGSSKAESSSHDSGPSSVPFRGSSVAKSRRLKAPAHTPASCSTWLLLDADERAMPFLRTLESSPPTARSSEKLTESTNTASTRSTVRSQASKYEDADDKRMSLQQGSVGKRGFMSRLRGAGSVSGASSFQATTAMTTSGSWAMVDSPASTEQTGSRIAGRTVHLAFTTLALEAATKHAHGLVGRASLRPAPTSEHTTELVHSDRVDVAGLAVLIASTGAEGVYIGSARSPSNSMQPFLEALLSISTLKIILLEPATTRRLTSTQASTLHDLARGRNITLHLPLRQTSLWTTGIEETLLGLELLHDVAEDEQARTAPLANGDADVSADNVFDVSMSNIPTGLSGDGLNGVEVETLKTQLEHLRTEGRMKDGVIAELRKQGEEQMGIIQTLKREKAVAEAAQAKALAAPAQGVEPKTPERSTVVALAAPLTQTEQTQGAAAAAAPRTPSKIASSGAAPITPSPSTAALARAAPITTPQPSSPSTGKSTAVIAKLTAELAETQQLLSATRTALSTVRAQSAGHQAAADEMRSTLGRARLENDSSVTILARKDRQVVEALERARKAEAECRDLGRASREWGTRVREVEEQLGTERVKRSRVEQAYELLGAEWKTARGRLIEEVKLLKEEHRQAVDGLAEEYKKVLTFKDRLAQENALLITPAPGTSDAEVIPPSKLLTELAGLNDKMQRYIEGQLQPLLARLARFEQRENAEVMDQLQVLTDELTRIKTLMRRGDVVDARQVPPGPF